MNNSKLELVKNSWWKYLLLLLLLLALVAVFYRRQTRFQQPINIDEPINNVETNNLSSFDLNTFPIEAGGELGIFYRLDCSYNELTIFRNYQQLPNLPGDWRCLAEISCQYLNKNRELETIYLPLHIYQPSTQQLLFVGGSIKQVEETEVMMYVEKADQGFYEAMIANALGKKPVKGDKIKIVANFPDEGFKNNETNGVAFDTLLEANPPYTQDDLIKLYQTGDSQYLPQIDGKPYFWPVVGYSF